MTANPASMTILAKIDTKGAVKQVLTFFFFSFGEHLTSNGTEAKRSRNGGYLQKKKEKVRT